MKKLLVVIVLFFFLVSVMYFIKSPTVITQKALPVEDEIKKIQSEEVILENLDIPWEIVFLPGSKDMLITERPGKLIRIGKDKKVIEVSGVAHVGEGGLLGMALHPKFAENYFIYLYITSQEKGQYVNRVERYQLKNDVLSDRKIIVSGIQGSSVHDGGRIAFGPDGYLYIGTGDAGNASSAQDVKSLNGKILRVAEDGTVPSDNPFGNAVYSYGHRNVQGLAWDSSGQLWATEHGRSGILSGLDELNRIEKGKNYGWPIIAGDETKAGMVTPVLHSGVSETWAPSGLAFIGDSLFFAGLRGQTLYQAKISGIAVVGFEKHLQQKYGRLRAVVIGLDGFLYIATNNTDGRGSVNAGDDKIIRFDLKSF